MQASAGVTYLLRGNRLLGGLVKFLDGLGIVTKIHLASDKDDRETLAEVKDLGNPLLNMLVIQNGTSP